MRQATLHHRANSGPNSHKQTTTTTTTTATKTTHPQPHIHTSTPLTTTQPSTTTIPSTTITQQQPRHHRHRYDSHTTLHKQSSTQLAAIAKLTEGMASQTRSMERCRSAGLYAIPKTCHARAATASNDHTLRPMRIREEPPRSNTRPIHPKPIQPHIAQQAPNQLGGEDMPSRIRPPATNTAHGYTRRATALQLVKDTEHARTAAARTRGTSQGTHMSSGMSHTEGSEPVIALLLRWRYLPQYQ